MTEWSGLIHGLIRVTGWPNGTNEMVWRNSRSGRDGRTERPDLIVTIAS
ncbi:MAG: hypothetical protein HC795_00625 [Coleofasciculaceae cyanobacterium RL_1_1]|nr:hypothetical protein [Coleofasciculaceae cyanobacterium RL_1_1]